MNRIRPLHLAIGCLALVVLGGIWWALANSGGLSVDPLPPYNPGPSIPENGGPIVMQSPDRTEAARARLGIPVDEHELPRAQSLTLKVRVVDASGAVIPTANVGLTSPSGRSVFSMRRPDEYHEFPELTPGTWELMTYAVSYVDQTQTVELKEAVEVLELEIQLEKALMLPVRFLTPTGDNAVEVLNSMEESPLNGFDLYAIATNARPDSSLPPMAPGARPQYGVGLFHSISGIVPGESAIPHPGAGYAGVLELKQPPPVYVSGILRETVLETIEVGQSGARELTFTVVPEQLLRQLGSVTIAVLDAETRTVIEGLHVTCDDANIDGSSQDGNSVGGDGRVTFSQRFPGWATVRAWASGYEVFQTAIRLEPGAELDLGTIYLEKGITVTGRVQNEAGEGVRSVFYSRDESWSAGSGPPEFGHTLGSSTRDGQLKLNGLGKRAYSVYVKALGYAPQAIRLDLENGTPEPITVTLRPATKTIFASRYDADITHRISVYDAAGVLCFSEFIPGKRTRDTWLAPGEYSLVTHHGPRELARRTIEITAESAVHSLNR